MLKWWNQNPVRGATVSTFGTAGGAFLGNCSLEGWGRQARMAFGVRRAGEMLMKECSGKQVVTLPQKWICSKIPTYTHLHSWRIMKESLRHSSTTFIVGCSPARDTSAKVINKVCTLVSPKLTAPRPVAWLLSNNNKTMLSSDENRIRSEEQPPQRLALLVAPFWGNCSLEGWGRQARMAFGVRRAVRCYEGVFRKQVVTLPQKWICSKYLHSSTLMKDHEGISSTFFDYIYSGLQPCKDTSAKVSTRLHTSSPKLTAPRPVAWLLSNNNKTMLSSDENRIRSEEQPSQRLALLVAPFWGIAPWKVEAGKQGWSSAFGVLWDAMKECSGNKLSHFRRNESAQNTYTHLHSWRIMKESLRHSSSTFIVGCSPARTRVQRYQQGCTLVHQKLTAPRPVAWLLSNNNKTMLSSDENRIRSEEQPSQRLALLVAPFWGIAPWQSSKILHPNSSHGVDPWVVVETSSYSKHILLQKDARGCNETY